MSYQNFLTDTQRLRINDVIPMLEAGGELHSRIHNLFNLYGRRGASDEYIESQIADLAYDIEKSIDKLIVGQSVLIPGGCTGHAILYQVQRIRENEFQFSIYNTGYGNEFGQLFLQGSDQFRVPLFGNLSKASVVDQKFLMDLIRYKVKFPYGMNDVHKTIAKHLKERHSAIQTVREPHDKQTWGTCSYDSVVSFLEYAFPPSLFKPFEYDIMLGARGDLNSLLSQGRGVLSKKALDFIDRKSCETVADRKEKFDAYCFPFGQGDLTIAKIVNIQSMKSQDDLKKLLEIWSDHDIADAKKLGFFDRISLAQELSSREGEGGMGSILYFSTWGGIAKDLMASWHKMPACFFKLYRWRKSNRCVFPAQTSSSTISAFNRTAIS